MHGQQYIKIFEVHLLLYVHITFKFQQ